MLSILNAFVLKTHKITFLCIEITVIYENATFQNL